MLYPILSSSRTKISLDGMWDFSKTSELDINEKNICTLQNKIHMPVPASYNDLTEEKSLRDHYGYVIYQRNVDIPKFLLSERLVLRCEAVTHFAKIFWNGKFVFQHKGGFLPFEICLDDIAKEGRNLLTIAVDNRINLSTLPVGNERGGGMLDFIKPTQNSDPQKKKNNPNFDFFNYAGITRSVSLYTTPKNFIKDITICSDIDYSSIKTSPETKLTATASLDFLIDIHNEEESLVKDNEIKVSIKNTDGDEVASAIGLTGKIQIKNAFLWEPLKPYLYEIIISYKDDIYILPYGIRTVKVDGGKFLINGKPFYFKGYGKHEDSFPAGRGINMPMNVKDISLMKWQGANSFRTSHYPYSEEMMRLCDKEGIVVIDETPAVGLHLNFGGGAAFGATNRVETFDPPEKGGIQTAEHHKEVIIDLISRDKNYACVVMWSLANEADSGNIGAYEYFEPLFKLAKKCDPQKRPCTIVSLQIPHPETDVSIKLSDVFCLNRYYGWYVCGGELDEAEGLLRKELTFWQSLGKPILMTEYGADTVSGLRDTIPVMFSEEYQVEYLKTNHKIFDEIPNFVGEQVWNFADFATSQSIMRVQGNKKGIFTRDRKPKFAAHYLKERWLSIPDFGYKE